MDEVETKREGFIFFRSARVASRGARPTVCPTAVRRMTRACGAHVCPPTARRGRPSARIYIAWDAVLYIQPMSAVTWGLGIFERYYL